ncbi:hypothetical protein [Moorena sp. SIO4G3]|nr:hypothetical protein [Moorena sp. SIO4G3]
MIIHNFNITIQRSAFSYQLKRYAHATRTVYALLEVLSAISIRLIADR